MLLGRSFHKLFGVLAHLVKHSALLRLRAGLLVVLAPHHEQIVSSGMGEMPCSRFDSLGDYT